METAKDILERANTVYYFSVNAEELGGAEREVKALIKQSWLSSENRERGESLMWRITAKRLALIYFEEGYDGEDAAALIDFAKEKASLAKGKGYEKTALILSALAECAARVNDVMKDADEIACKVRSREWKRVAESEEVCREAERAFAQKEKQIEAIAFPSPLFNKGVKFPDVKAEILRELKKVRVFAEKCAFELECKRGKDVITGLRDIRETTEWKYCEYTALIDASQANTMFLCTPFQDEAELFIVQNSKGPIYELSGDLLAGRSEEGLKKTFEIFLREKAAVVVTGLNGYGDENEEEIFRLCTEYGKGGNRAFIVDSSGNRELYTRAAHAVGAEDIGFTYLTMPGFIDVKEFFRARGMIEDSAEDMRFMREYLPFMGYAGLNMAVRARARGIDWRKVVTAHVRGRAERAEKYLKELPTQSQLLDSGWGDYSDPGKAPAAKSEFNYDGIAEVDKGNIQKIMNAPVIFYQRCGMLVTYCCCAGADFSVWGMLSIEEKQDRVSLATRLLMSAMGVKVKGRVEFYDSIPGAKKAEGMCCNGGQVIMYRNGLLKSDPEYVAGVIAHECMHALQYQAKTEGWSEWMYRDAGVTFSRVEEWTLNYSHKIDEPYNKYRNQVLEADAEAFAYDCTRGVKDVWHTIDLD